MRPIVIVMVSLMLTGCVEHITRAVVSAPFKVVAVTAHTIAPGHAESDRKRGRAMREKEQEQQKLARKCTRSDAHACEKNRL